MPRLILSLWLSLSLSLSACFNPEPPELIPCSETGACPPGQSCGVDGLCRAVVSPVDGSTGESDSAPPIDGQLISDLGRSCSASNDCAAECLVDGPGNDPFFGFCTRECDSQPEICGVGYLGPGIPTCTNVSTTSPLRHCAIVCFSSFDCPQPLGCVLSTEPGICDVIGTMPPADAGGDAGVGDAGGPAPPPSDF